MKKPFVLFSKPAIDKQNNIGFLLAIGGFCDQGLQAATVNVAVDYYTNGQLTNFWMNSAGIPVGQVYCSEKNKNQDLLGWGQSPNLTNVNPFPENVYKKITVDNEQYLMYPVYLPCTLSRFGCGKLPSSLPNRFIVTIGVNNPWIELEPIIVDSVQDYLNGLQGKSFTAVYQNMGNAAYSYLLSSDSDKVTIYNQSKVAIKVNGTTVLPNASLDVGGEIKISIPVEASKEKVSIYVR